MHSAWLRRRHGLRRKHDNVQRAGANTFTHSKKHSRILYAFFVGSSILPCWLYEINLHYSFALALICSAICFITLDISHFLHFFIRNTYLLGNFIFQGTSDLNSISSLKAFYWRSHCDSSSSSRRSVFIPMH